LWHDILRRRPAWPWSRCGLTAFVDLHALINGGVAFMDQGCVTYMSMHGPLAGVQQQRCFSSSSP
jgi:hypothetical protein